MIRDFSAQLTEKTTLAGEVWHLRFKMDGEPLQFTAGQYVIIKIGENYRQYSIASSAQHGETFDLVVEFFPGGVASEFLKALEIGQSAQFKGPAGIFMLRPTDTDKIFLATGTGIAPEKSMIETYLASGGPAKIALFFGLKTVQDAYLQAEFAELAEKHQNFDYTYCFSREEYVTTPHAIKGHVQDAVDAFMKDKTPADFEYYVCGGKDVVEVMKEYAATLGGQPDKIHSEKFTL